MSSRVQPKAAARQRREEIEAQAERAAERRRNRSRLAVVAIAALAVVATLVVLTRPDDPAANVGTPTSGQLAGIPQDGLTLGNPDAPATLVEFADPQCPFCADFSRDVLPTLVDRYVRRGKLKLELRVLSFLGDDSVRAAGMAGAAAEQDRLWDFAEAFYLAQGTENSGYVTDEFLSETATGAGLDVERAMDRRDDQDLQTAQDLADELGVSSTPSFVLRIGAGDPAPVAPEALTPEAFTAALDEALAR